MAPKHRVPHAADVADATANVVNAASAPNVLRMANAKRTGLAMQARQATRTAMTTRGVKPVRVKAVKAGAAVAAGVVAMTVARVWTKQATRLR
jgi:hypothetical protein